VRRLTSRPWPVHGANAADGVRSALLRQSLRHAFFLGGLLISFLVAIGDAAALDLSEWVRGLQVMPFLSERIEYQTNVFQTPSRAQSDVIFRTIPGILVEYGTGPDVLSAGYKAEFLKFLDGSSPDAVHHLFAGQLLLGFNRLQVRARNEFIKTTDPPGSELTGRIESTTNTFAADAGYSLTDRFGLAVNGGWTHAEFPTIGQLSRDEYLVGASVFWKVRPKADLSFGYNYGHKTFEEASLRDIDRHFLYFGVLGELTAKLSSTFRIGYAIRDSQRVGVPGYKGFAMGGDWIYRPTDRLTITLTTDRSDVESAFGNQPFYVSTTAALVAAQEFGPKLTTRLQFAAGDDSYPGKETFDGETKVRHDTLLRWGGEIRYDVQRWLRVGVEYTHTLRSSNFRAFNFQDDKIAGTVTVQF
jgi:hypothetical protein